MFLVWKKKIKELFILCLAAFLLTTIFTWPYVTRLFDFYSDNLDMLYLGSVMWHTYKAIISGSILHQSSYFQTNQFYPWPNTLTFSEHFFLPSLIFTVVYTISSQFIFSVNTFVFLSFPLSFLAAYFVFYRLINSKIAAGIGAFVYTFNPLTFAHFQAGHYQLLSRFFLPFIFFYAYKWICVPTKKHSFLFLLAFTLNALSAIYFFIFSIVLLCFYLPLGIVVKYLHNKTQYMRSILVSIIIAIPFVLILLWFSIPYYSFMQQEQAKRSIYEGMYYGFEPLDWVTSTKTHLLYGPFTSWLERFRPDGNNFNYSEHTLFLNIVPLFLVIFGFWYFLYRQPYHSQTNELFLFLGFLSLLIMSCIIMSSIGYAIFYTVFPFMQGVRVPTRIQFLMYVPFSYFVAYGVYALQKTNKKMLLILCVVVLTLENFYGLPYHQDKALPHSVVTKLQGSTFSFLNNAQTIHFPLYTGKLIPGSHMYWSIFTGEKTINGYSGFFPYDWSALIYQFRYNLNSEVVKKLQALDIHYAIFHKYLLDEKEVQKYNTLFKKFRIAYEDKEILIFDLDPGSLDIQKCDFSKDIIFSNPQTIQIVGKTVRYMQVKNTRDCYLISPFTERYRQIEKDGKKIKVTLPTIISPKETTVALYQD